MQNIFFQGVVEDRMDPLQLGRCKVRIVGVHTHDKSILPTDDLPWAFPMVPITSASMNGIGQTPLGPVEGSWVVIFFRDGDEYQQPVMMGTLGGVPIEFDTVADFDVNSNAAITSIENEESNTPPTVPETGPLQVSKEGTVLGSLTAANLTALKNAIAERESRGSGGYKATNMFGYLGKYQFGFIALVELGYIKKSVPNPGRYCQVALEDRTSWSGKNNMNSQTDFLNSGPEQEAAMDLFLRKEYNQLGIDSSVPPEKTAGLLAAAHLKGAGRTKKWLSGKATQNELVDGNGTHIMSYYVEGYKAVLGKPTNEIPTYENIKSASSDKETIGSTDASQFAMPKQKTLVQDSSIGFVDPEQKYPKNDFLNEPDTNRLARRSKIQETLLKEKEDVRRVSIPVANSATTWEQPAAPYNAHYPFNHVYQSESGHTLEFDDTPHCERVQLYHTAGSFLEIDRNGTQVNKIVGNGYTIYDNDGLITIAGEAVLSVYGNIAIYSHGDTNIEVKGKTKLHSTDEVNIQTEGNLKIGCQDFILGCSSFNVTSSGVSYLQSGGTIAMDGSAVHMNSGVAQPKAYQPIEQFTPPFVQMTVPNMDEEIMLRLEEVDDNELTAMGIDPAKPELQGGTASAEADNSETNHVKPTATTCDGLTSPITKSTQLSLNYTVSKLTKGGGLQAQHGLTEEEIACNLRALAVNVIEPILAKYPDLLITSCFRTANNSLSMKDKISQHEKGEAVDLTFSSIYPDKSKTYDRVLDLKNIIPFDQIIYEVKGGKCWIHISYSRTQLRRNILTYNGTTALQGLHKIS